LFSFHCRDADRSRMEQFDQERKEMQERIQRRPLLFEQESQVSTLNQLHISIYGMHKTKKGTAFTKSCSPLWVQIQTTLSNLRRIFFIGVPELIKSSIFYFHIR